MRIGAWWDRLRGAESRRLRARIAELRAANAALRQAQSAQTGQPVYSALVPHADNALGLFSGSWSSRLPHRDGPGRAELFADPRIEWLFTQCGSLEGARVLELGPLEGGHTYMLEQRGAAVTAIEGNHEAFVRSVVVKNVLGLRANFLLGDFARSFGSDERWDLVVASGVLYHMSDPVGLLTRIAATTDRLYLWTHYFEPDVNLWHPETATRIGTKWVVDDTIVERVGDLDVHMVPMLYQEALGWAGFCGGPETFARWIHKSDLVALLRVLGFDSVSIAFDEPGHVNGPSFAVFARRS